MIDRLFFRKRFALPVFLAGELAQYLIFQIGNQSCAAAYNEVSEIVPMSGFESFPTQSPEILAGVWSRADLSCPVLYLNRILNLKEMDLSAYEHILLVENEGTMMGFLIQPAQKILAVSPSSIRAFQSDIVSDPSFSHGAVSDGRGHVSVVELKQIVAYFENLLHFDDEGPVGPLGPSSESRRA